MPNHALPDPEALLPLVRSLPAGAVAGIALPSGGAAFLSRRESLVLGQWVRSDADLRHAALHSAGCLVLDPARLAPALLGAALAGLSGRGVVVLLCSPDIGLLARWADRVCFADAPGVGWRRAEELRSRRCLELLVGDGVGEGRWVRLPLGAGDAPERHLAAVRAEGLRVRESHISYTGASAR